MQWMVPRNRLGDAQVQVLNRCLQMKQGRIWIQGVAGSGKTILLVHAISEALVTDSKLSVCVVVYTHALKDLVTTGLPSHLGQIPVMTYHNFLTHPRNYDVIVVDEVQDLEERTLKTVAQYAKKLIVAGDGDQSIYDQRVSAADIERLLSPEKHLLDVLYRLTQTVRDLVRTILPKTPIESSKIARLNADVKVRLVRAAGVEKEIDWVWRESCKFALQGDPAAILLPRHTLITRFIKRVCTIEHKPQSTFEKNTHRKVDYDQVNDHLRSQGLCLRYIGNDYGKLGESDERPIVYLMTYHSAKGLDYDTVFLPHLDDSTDFWSDDEALARRLFFVAATRSRRNLFFSHHSQQPHPYIRAMPQHLLHKFDCPDTTSNSSPDLDLF